MKKKKSKKVKEEVEIVVKTDLTFEELLELAANTPPFKKGQKLKEPDRKVKDTGVKLKDGNRKLED